MKKIGTFLILILCITIIPSINVNAISKNFYEGEYIKGIWMNKQKNGTIYYQTARFFRQVETNNFAYCIEPFEMFNENSTYTPTLTPSNLNNYQKQRISLIAYFGYGYKHHTDLKWYAITQMMIWKESDPTGNYYFTNKLNGDKIDIYQQEMNEINSLINNYLILPSISNNEYNIVENEEINIIDTNNTLNQYQIQNNNNLTIINNTLNIKNLKEGNYEINLTKKESIYNRPLIFYESYNSQNLVETGDIENNISLKINVKKTALNITKIDSDNKTTISSGEGVLSGAIYNLFDKDMNKIGELTIDKNMKSKIENLKYGKYYLKEKIAGTGYELDNKTYEFELNEKINIINLTLENTIIKKKIEIHKVYGEPNNTKGESNISFNIYDKNYTIVKTITTNNEGFAEIELPYGNYTIKQVNTTEGYELSNDLEIKVKDNKKETYKLYDYKIKVPDTVTNNKNIYYMIQTLIILILSTRYVKKKLFN